MDASVLSRSFANVALEFMRLSDIDWFEIEKNITKYIKSSYNNVIRENWLLVVYNQFSIMLDDCFS